MTRDCESGVWGGKTRHFKKSYAGVKACRTWKRSANLTPDSRPNTALDSRNCSGVYVHLLKV